MRHIFLIAAIAACGSPAEDTSIDTSIDSGVAQMVDAKSVDSLHDASKTGECMGNLPLARTATINTGDPVPPGLLNELQDMAVGAKRGSYSRRFQPQWWHTGAGGTVECSTDPGSNLYPVWKLNAASSAATQFSTPMYYEPGSIISAVSVDAYSDGSNALDVFVNYLPAPSSGAGATVAIAHLGGISGASWSTSALTMDTTSQVLSGSGLLYLAAEVVGGGGGAHFFYFGNVTLTLARP